MKVKVNTLWNGMVGINEERYIKPAIEKKESLVITYAKTGEVMEIPAHQVSNYEARSERQFRDKYGGASYFLVYYKWKPTAKQMGFM